MPRIYRAEVATIAVSLCAAFSISTEGRAATWTVRPEGNGNRPTIQAAIDDAAPGDTIRLEGGIYKGPGNRDLTTRGKAIAILGIDGAEATVIDCEGKKGDPHRGFLFDKKETKETLLSGVTITGGYVEGPLPACYGGAILCLGASPTIRDCRLIRNRSNHFGGAMVCYEGASPRLERVEFIENEAVNNGGAFGSKMRSEPFLREVLFVRNKALRGGAVWCWSAAVTIERATFYGNEASVSTACVWSSEARVTVRTSILAFSAKGDALACTNPPPDVKLVNCNIFGNEGGDALPPCVRDGGGNFSLDPKFCAPKTGDFRLASTSPCAPGNHPAGREAGWIGARESCGGK